MKNSQKGQCLQVVLIQPSSAAAERDFSLLTNSLMKDKTVHCRNINYVAILEKWFPLQGERGRSS